MNLHKMKVFKAKNGKFKNMWKGECKCGHAVQYWSWGAVLGSVWLHYWKESYA